jgi:hypothetical protein
MTTHPGAPAITNSILKLARQLDATGELIYVEVQPRQECELNGCFDNVRRLVAKLGGSIQHGWRISEQPQVYVEAAFHAVWRSSDGSLIDVTPRAGEQTRILFLPDFKKVWDGETVEPRRLMLHQKPCYCGSGMPFRICHGLADD